MNDPYATTPESWACIDCGINTAPGVLNREQLKQQLALAEKVTINFTAAAEVYTVKPKVWKAARVPPLGGCLCIGCLEQRLGRTLTFKDFDRKHPFMKLPGTARLLDRRGWRP